MSENNENNNDDTRMSTQDIIKIKMTNIANQAKKSKLISGLAYIVLGLVLLFWPAASMAVICRMIGAALLFVGIFTGAIYFTLSAGTPYRFLSLVAGVPLALFGLFLFMNPDFLAEFIPIIVGIILIISGTTSLFDSITLMKYGYDKWWISLICAVITVIFGIVLIAKPFGAASVLTQVIGIATIAGGISDIYVASRIKSVVKVINE